MESGKVLKHAVISAAESDPERCVETELSDGRTVCLTEKRYFPEELRQFRSEESKWIVRREGSRCFLADHDNGEDADGYYCGFFDLDPERAVFENGKLVGFYLCTDGMRYCGNDRSSFEITNWGYPGSDLFGFTPWGAQTHVFLFSESGSHEWKEWALLERDAETEYKSYLDF